MSRVIIEGRVFIATPGGLDQERNAFRETIAEYNAMDAVGRGMLFSPVGWDITLGGVGRPQSLINEELATCDHFILVLWDRWGTPTGREERGGFTSGCEEEFHLALRCLEDDRRPMRDVTVLFKAVDPRQMSDPGDQLKKVLEFRKGLETSKQHLFMTFDTAANFKATLRRFLARWDTPVRKWHSAYSYACRYQFAAKTKSGKENLTLFKSLLTHIQIWRRRSA